MITQDEINNLNVGIYEFYWKTGGSSILALDVTREGNRWIAPLNWSYPSDINAIQDGSVIRYEKLMDRKGSFHIQSTESSFSNIQEALDNTANVLDQLEKEYAEHNRKIRKNLKQTRIGFSILGIILIVSLFIVL